MTNASAWDGRTVSQSRDQITPRGDAGARVAHAHDELPVTPPYRLDLTVSALRRLPTNAVDVLTPDGAYLRAFAGAHGRVVVQVSQTGPARLALVITGDERDHAVARAAARRMLGVDCDLMPFDRASERIPWLAPLAARMRGLKPPHATGLSASKRVTLRRAATAIAAGTMSEQLLAACASPQAAARLCEIKGIGPWSAAVILLRGLGRLDVFPVNDSSVRRNLLMIAPAQRVNIARALDALRPQQGMLYYHLLLARLEARGGLGAASVSALGRAPGDAP
jgi:3-methyladenine DNA glycosylase/8-oxoguanine DNA glycosylase